MADFYVYLGCSLVCVFVCLWAPRPSLLEEVCWNVDVRSWRWLVFLFVCVRVLDELRRSRGRTALTVMILTIVCGFRSVLFVSPCAGRCLFA